MEIKICFNKKFESSRKKQTKFSDRMKKYEE